MVDTTPKNPQIRHPDKSRLIYYLRDGEKEYTYHNPQTWREKELSKDLPILNVHMYDGWSPSEILQHCVYDYDPSDACGEKSGVQIYRKTVPVEERVYYEEDGTPYDPNAITLPVSQVDVPAELPGAPRPFTATVNHPRQSAAKPFAPPRLFSQDTSSGEASSSASPKPPAPELVQGSSLTSDFELSKSAPSKASSSFCSPTESGSPSTTPPHPKSPKDMECKSFQSQQPECSSSGSPTQLFSSASPKFSAPGLVQGSRLTSDFKLSNSAPSKASSSFCSPTESGSPSTTPPHPKSPKDMEWKPFQSQQPECSSSASPKQLFSSTNSSSMPATPTPVVSELVQTPTLSSDGMQPDSASKHRRRSTFPAASRKGILKNATKPAAKSPKFLDTAEEKIIRERMQTNPYNDPSYTGAKALQLHYNVNLYPSPTIWKPEVFDSLNEEAATGIRPPGCETTPLAGAEASDLDQHYLGCVIDFPGSWKSDILKNKPLIRHPRYEATQFESALKKHAQSLMTAMDVNVAGVYKETGYSLQTERKRIDEISKENFNLKLKLFNLNQKIEKTEPHYESTLAKENLMHRLQTQEAMRECRRIREAAREIGKRIRKLEATESARAALLKSNRNDPPAELEKKIQFRLEECQKYHIIFKDMQEVIISQDQEMIQLKEAVESLKGSNAPSYAEIEELRRENLQLKAENERLVAERQVAEKKLKIEEGYTFDLRESSFEKDQQLIEFRGVVARLQGEIRGLTDIQHHQRCAIREHEKEILMLKEQLDEYHCDMLPKQEDLVHTELLVATLREQLSSAKQRLEQERATVDELLEESSGAKAEQCAECALRKSPAMLGDTPLSELVTRIIEKHDAKDPDASALCQGIHYMELYFLALIDKLKYAMVVEDGVSRNQLIKEEVAKLENICHSGIFPSASYLLKTEDKYEKQSRKLEDIKLVIQIQEEYAKLKKEDPSFGVYERDELLLSLLRDLSTLVPTAELLDPVEDFEKFQAAAKDIVAAVAQLVNNRASPDVQQTNEQSMAVDSIHQRDELLLTLLKGLSELVPVSEICDPADDFDKFQSIIKAAVGAVNCLVNDKISFDVHQASEEVKAHARNLEEQLDDKMAELQLATEKVNSFSTRYSDLKEKAIILKHRLNKARLQNETLNQRVRSLEDFSVVESLAFDHMSVDD
ncbi:hypothetical protein DSO57_1004232 [Entomophthora muscae]|uniref:Uncharacterized protein n=1 Tax=Entomophthora muscae TaxID=34485 RepID=A0ACC2RN19_9FUNG|nr:hypothetical protein DSO57_1004232 [Entomophthora muscae]